MAFIPLLVASLAASATALHIAPAPHAAILRREPAATTTAAASAVAAAATTVAAAASSSASFCCIPADTRTLPTTLISSCESRFVSFLEGSPTPPAQLNSLPFYSGDQCTTSVPASLSSVLASYESAVISYFEPILSEYNSLVETDCSYLSINAYAIVNGLLVAGSCSTRATGTATVTGSGTAATATTATTSVATAKGSSTGSSTGSASGAAATSGSMARGNSGFVGAAAMVVAVFLGAVTAM